MVWRHTHYPEEAVELIRFLISKEVQSEYCRHVNLLPVRTDMQTEAPYGTDPHYQTVFDILKNGRSYPAVPKWGLVEEKLNQSLTWLWDTVLTDPEQDLDGLVKPYMESIARRLAVTLGLRR